MERRPDRPVPDQHDHALTPGAGGWRLAAGQQLAHRDWDGEIVLYNDLSGDTHLLGRSAFALLQALARGPAGEDALAQAAGLSPEEAGPILDELEALALAEYHPC